MIWLNLVSLCFQEAIGPSQSLFLMLLVFSEMSFLSSSSVQFPISCLPSASSGLLGGQLLGLFFPDVTVVWEGALGVLDSLCRFKFLFQFFHGF